MPGLLLFALLPGWGAVLYAWSSHMLVGLPIVHSLLLAIAVVFPTHPPEWAHDNLSLLAFSSTLFI